MLFKPAQRCFTVFEGIFAVLEPPDELAGEGEIAFWLDRHSDEIGVQTMSQPPRIANDLAGMRGNGGGVAR